NGNPVREYASYPGVDHPHSVRRSSDGAIFYYTTEGPGHVASLVDTLKNMVNRYEYTPWGDAISATEGVVQPLRYGAREYDAETGLYYNRARYYDPKLARFVSQDPIGLAGGINPYVYAQDDPVNGRDPSGLDGFDPCPSGYVYEVLEEDNGDGTVTTTESCVRTGTASLRIRRHQRGHGAGLAHVVWPCWTLGSKESAAGTYTNGRRNTRQGGAVDVETQRTNR
ncbi:MAG: RHS repeat-associated core domain-containing protein, partial [Deltaproteobacteria bacterium]